MYEETGEEINKTSKNKALSTYTQHTVPALDHDSDSLQQITTTTTTLAKTTEAMCDCDLVPSHTLLLLY